MTFVFEGTTDALPPWVHWMVLALVKTKPGTASSP
jgi:hypothetical protein